MSPSFYHPSITFASLVWWPGFQTLSAEKTLHRIQRPECFAITGAMRTTPTVLWRHSPSSTWFVVQGEGISAAHRLWSLRCWSYLHPKRRHSSILTRLRKSDLIFNTGVDIIRPAGNLESKYRVTMLTTEEWTKAPGTSPAVKGLVWYIECNRKRRETHVYGQYSGRRLNTSYAKMLLFSRPRYVILACA